jgi:NDP-sugar pyrophosphorylase family protein
MPFRRVLWHHDRGAVITRDYLGGGTDFGAEIVYAVEREPLGSGGGMKLATFPLLASEAHLGAFPSHCYWRPIDTAKNLRDARTELSGGLPELPLPETTP